MVFFPFLAVLGSCSQGRAADIAAPKTLTVTSPDFTDEISATFANAPPKLVWSEAPSGTEEIAIIVDDPDAPTSEPYVHYVLTRVATKRPSPGPIVGKNESGKTAWEPLDPPAGETHRYFFRVYALDVSLGDQPKTKAGVLSAIKGHVLAWGELIGRYGKK